MSVISTLVKKMALTRPNTKLVVSGLPYTFLFRNYALSSHVTLTVCGVFLLHYNL